MVWCGWFTVIAALGLVAAPLAALAQDQEPGSVPRVTTSTPSPERTRDTGGDRAWELYDLAFRQLASGHVEEARLLLDQLARTLAPHPAAKRARELLGYLAAPVPLAPAAGNGLMESTRDGPPTGLARAELVIGQTLHGIGVGLEIAALAKSDDPRALGALMVGFGGAALTASLYLTDDGITPGHTQALNAGTEWGFFNGLMLAGVIRSGDFFDSGAQLEVGLLLGGQLTGLATGEVLWRLTHGGPGDFSLASSMGLWAGAFTLTMFGAAEFDVDAGVVFGVMMAAVDSGLIAGALLASAFAVSRGHVLAIDGGGILGSLLGLGVSFIAMGDSIKAAPMAISTAIGMAGGLGLVAYLTRNWDAPDVPLHVSLLPVTNGGGMLTVGGLW